MEIWHNITIHISSVVIHDLTVHMHTLLHFPYQMLWHKYDDLRNRDEIFPKLTRNLNARSFAIKMESNPFCHDVFHRIMFS